MEILAMLPTRKNQSLIYFVCNVCCCCLFPVQRFIFNRNRLDYFTIFALCLSLIIKRLICFPPADWFLTAISSAYISPHYRILIGFFFALSLSLFISFVVGSKYVVFFFPKTHSSHHSHAV